MALNPIKFRWRVPPPDAAAGDGHVDELADAFQAMREQLDGLGADDPYRDVLRTAAGAVVNCLERARRLLWDAGDDMHGRTFAAQAIVEGEAQRAAQGAAQVPGNTYSDFAQSQAGAANAVRTRAEIATRDAVVEARRDQASKVARDFGEAWAALCVAVDKAWADWTGPASLRTGTDWRLEDLSRETQAAQEIRGAVPTPMTYALTQLRMRLSTMGDDDEDGRAKLDLFILAVRTVALEMRDMIPAKIIARYDLKERDAMGERDMARQVLQQLDELKKSQTPGSFGVVFDLMNGVRDLAFAIFGVALRQAALAEYTAKGLPPNMKRVGVPTPWDQMPSSTWPAKWLGSSSTGPKLPGWSPIRSKTSAGVPVRVPR